MAVAVWLLPFQEFSASHTRFSLYYAVLEGVLFNLMQCYERLVVLNGPEEKICLSGGILNSPIWLPMCLDFFGKPLYEIREKHSSLLGGILLGLQLTNPEALASYEERKQKTAFCNLPERRICFTSGTAATYTTINRWVRLNPTR